MEVLFNGQPKFLLEKCTDYITLKSFLESQIGLKSNGYYLISNGKRLNDGEDFESTKVYVVPRTLGGKGGFGSMLRAIGAQIEKTTNREACRDLSGRRLRDINEEQRLKTWINQQAEREKEAKERKQKKLERLCEAPKHEFRDAQYDKERSELPELVEDAVLRGLQASCSTKRKASEEKHIVKKKKPKLWVDDELDDLSSSDAEGAESESEENKIVGTSKSSDSDNSNSSNIADDSANKLSENSTKNVDPGNDEKQTRVDDNVIQAIAYDGPLNTEAVHTSTNELNNVGIKAESETRGSEGNEGQNVEEK